MLADIDEGCVADCTSSRREPLTSESSNYSDVSMIISSPEPERKSMIPNQSGIESHHIDQSDQSVADDDKHVFTLRLWIIKSC